MTQAEVVAALAEFARRWQDPSDPYRRRAEALHRPFPFAMTRVSLDALLRSLMEAALWKMIDAEGVRDAFGAPRVGHVIAGNTPLLAWTSLLRALLMRGVSRVKLPSNDAALWGMLFHESLQAAAPALAQSIMLEHWTGGDAVREREFLADCDVVLAYGQDETLAALARLCPPETALIGYGHRVSLGLVLPDADIREASSGLARDVLLYDQGGCLSPQTVFVLGGRSAARSFAASLATALEAASREFPLTTRTPQAQARVREARALAQMEPEAQCWLASDLQWTVIARPDTAFSLSPTHGVVSVQPLAAVADLPSALSPVRGALQGVAIAGTAQRWEAEAALTACGASYLCRPGELQAPPLSWPQDNIPPLRSLQAMQEFRYTIV